MSKLNEITAEHLKKISERVEVNIDPVLEKCLAEANKGERFTFIYEYLDRNQVGELFKRGFSVVDTSSQFDGHLFKISW